MQLSFYNTLSKSIQPFTPADGSNTVRVYSCGPTVYDVAHIGNMRAFLAADAIQRTVRSVGGYDVRWVMNITDIDDKTIDGSREGSTRWIDAMGARTGNVMSDLRLFTTYWADQFLADIQTLGIKIDHFEQLPRATDYIDSMMDLIVKIVESGYGYVSEGSVYFNVAKYGADHEYGRLFQIDRANFREGVRIDADEYDRESVSDFVLWKGRKGNEPYWDLVVGGETLPGRPGWHIECSAMSYDLLAPFPFDIHTGGVDLRFPHHEDELAQSCAGYHVGDQANFWVHNEFLEVEGKKMSKSLGNFYTLRDLLDKGYDPLDIRYSMMSSHYRSVYNFTMDGIKSARAARLKVQDYIWDLVEITGGFEADVDDEPRELVKVFEALADDVHTPRALAELFTFINANPAEGVEPERASALLNEFGRLNGVFGVWTASPRPELDIPDEVLDIADERWEARLAKNWAEADRLRDELARLGWVMKDGKDGYDLEPIA